LSPGVVGVVASLALYLRLDEHATVMPG